MRDIDKKDRETIILNADTVLFSNFTSEIGPSIATDGSYLYLSKKVNNQIRPAVYDLSEGTFTPVGPAQQLAVFEFTKWGRDVYVRYDAVFERSIYQVTASGLGQPLAVDNFGHSGSPTFLADYFVSLYNGSNDVLTSVDKVTGDSTQLLRLGIDNYANFLPISAWEFVFLTTRGEGEGLKLWRSDGTRSGTRQVLTVPQTAGESIPWLYAFGQYVAFDTGEENLLHIYNPQSNSLEIIAYPNEANVWGELNGALYFTARDSTFGKELHRLRVAPSDYITGTVFYDANQNGIQDEDEEGIVNARVNVTGARNLTVFTGDDGRFGLPVQEGQSYNVAATDVACYQTLTTPSEYAINYSPDDNYQLDFGYAEPTGETHLAAFLNSGTIRCGFEHNFWLTILNDGCQPLAGEGSVTYPEEMDFLESDVPPLSNEDNTLLFAFDTLQPGASRQFRIRFRMPDENFAGQDINLGAAAGAMNVEGALVQSDTFAYSEILRCAIDPNDKQVSPNRAEPSNSNYTQIDESLRYTIRFQNTGNDTAFTVRIEDQISESLDLETLKPLAASHPYSISVREDRTLVFLFENILLPDSTTNLPGSQGFVTFEINAYPDLEDFSAIENTAGIYFDFNQPVITNTVTSTLVEFLDEDQDGFLFYDDCNDTNRDINPVAEEIPGNGIDENCDDLDDFPVSTQNQLSASLRLYPNPVTDHLSIEYSATAPLSVNIFNATGRLIRNFTLRGRHQLNLVELPAGLYLLYFQDAASGETATVRIVKQ